MGPISEVLAEGTAWFMAPRFNRGKVEQIFPVRAFPQELIQEGLPLGFAETVECLQEHLHRRAMGNRHSTASLS